jgi:hypothetical protein
MGASTPSPRALVGPRDCFSIRARHLGDASTIELSGTRPDARSAARCHAAALRAPVRMPISRTLRLAATLITPYVPTAASSSATAENALISASTTILRQALSRPILSGFPQCARAHCRPSGCDKRLVWDVEVSDTGWTAGATRRHVLLAGASVGRALASRRCGIHERSLRLFRAVGSPAGTVHGSAGN